MADPYRAPDAGRRELVVVVGNASLTWPLVVAGVATLLVLRALALPSWGRLALVAAVLLLIVGVLRVVRERGVVLSRERILLISLGWPRATLSAIVEPRSAAVSCTATGALLNDEVQMAVDVVGDRGKLGFRTLGFQKAQALAADLRRALSELGLLAEGEALQGSVRERTLVDGRVELRWRAPRMTGLWGSAKTRLWVSHDGFSVERSSDWLTSRGGGRGPVRASVAAVRRDHLPERVDPRAWHLELRDVDGRVTTVGDGLTRYELNWLAERIAAASRTELGGPESGAG